jgi:4-hydroxy-tetrahydrodipicolinate synthase
MARAAQAGETEKAMQIDAAFAPLWALFKEFASIRVIYAAANLLALTDAQPPRPILPIPEADTARLRAAIAPLADWPAP